MMSQAYSPEDQTIVRIRARLVRVFSIISILRFIFPGAATEILLDGASFSGASVSFFLALLIFSFWIILTFLDRVNLAAFGLSITLVGLTLLPESLNQLLPLIAVLAVSTVVRDWRLFTTLTVLLYGFTTYQIYSGITEGQPLQQTMSQFGLIVAMLTASITLRYFFNSFQRTLDVAE
ncbi:MAG: hypothetical protein AAF653_04070, partial [Chloroflexota bacterium]